VQIGSGRVGASFSVGAARNGAAHVGAARNGAAHNGAAGEGLGAGYEPSGSVVDAVVGLAQLAQILLYRLDGIDRGRSKTLWMRRLAVASPGPGGPSSSAIAGSIAVARTTMLKLGDATWRNSELIGEFGDLRVTCVVAHQLPTAE